MKIPLIDGRAFHTGDLSGMPSVAIVNQAFVKQYIKGRDPIGLRLGGDGVKDRTG